MCIIETERRGMKDNVSKLFIDCDCGCDVMKIEIERQVSLWIAGCSARARKYSCGRKGCVEVPRNYLASLTIRSAARRDYE